jgi:hypothetical protein
VDYLVGFGELALGFGEFGLKGLNLAHALVAR